MSVLLDFQFTPYLFVYGTLKKGYGNNRLLYDSEFVCEEETKDSYFLGGSSIPYMIPPEFAPEGVELHPVRGEVWKLDDHYTLDIVDSLEGHPRWYYRSLITTSQGPTWSYFMTEERYSSSSMPVVNGAYQWPKGLSYDYEP